MHGSDLKLDRALQGIRSALRMENVALLLRHLRTLKFETPVREWSNILGQLRGLRNVYPIPRDARDEWFGLELGTPDWGDTLADDSHQLLYGQETDSSLPRSLSPLLY